MPIAFFRRAYSSFAVHVLDVPSRLLSFLFLLLFLFLPITGMGPHYLGIFVSVHVLAIFAASWDLLVGRTGQISLGHALFWGIGAYSTALLFKYYGLPLWITIPLSLLIGVLVAFLIGFPCLRVKGPYLALVTMAFPLILLNLVKYGGLSQITGGEFGIRPLPSFFPFLPFLPINQQRIAEYYFTLLLLAFSAMILHKIANSKTGIVFVSILDNELASKASGINVTKYKLMAFAISGLFASLAGSVNAHLLTLVNPATTFELTLSFTPIIVTTLGGLGTIYGPIVGAYIYYIVDKYILTFLIPMPYGMEHVKLLFFTLIVIILVIKWPRGIARFVTDKLEDLQKARELEERDKHIWKRKKK